MHVDTRFKNVFVYAQVSPRACYALLVIVEIFLIPSLPGLPGCFRVSGMGDGGNAAEGRSMCGRRAEKTFAGCCL